MKIKQVGQSPALLLMGICVLVLTMPSCSSDSPDSGESEEGYYTLATSEPEDYWAQLENHELTSDVESHWNYCLGTIDVISFGQKPVFDCRKNPTIWNPICSS